jgi:hypothetical protein
MKGILHAFCFCVLAGCEAKIFCGSKNFCVGRLWRTSVRWAKTILNEKMAVAPATFFDQMGKSIF